MKTSLAIVVGAVVLLAAEAPRAQDAKAPASSPGTAAMQPASPMGMGHQMGQMDEHMKKMQALREKMASATTPEERQRLMTEQRQEMQQGMAMMPGMQKGGAMMGGAGMGMTGRKGGPADQATRMQMMEKRMDMMQSMIQAMMDQQGASGGGMMPAPAR
ncbi:hypothetical protein BURK1_00315 [Burkholderiales bacterium]|nr:hypothetical protein BURK1_00315 [Burkholderiales bacterium]